MTKFVGKFRKNQDYNEDYSYMPKRKHRNEHSEIKKLLTNSYDELDDKWEDEYVPELDN